MPSPSGILLMNCFKIYQKFRISENKKLKSKLTQFLELQRRRSRGSCEDSGDDGRRDRVRELHLRERRGALPLHRTHHDPHLHRPGQHHPHELARRFGGQRYSGDCQRTNQVSSKNDVTKF